MASLENPKLITLRDFLRDDVDPQPPKPQLKSIRHLLDSEFENTTRSNTARTRIISKKKVRVTRKGTLAVISFALKATVLARNLFRRGPERRQGCAVSARTNQILVGDIIGRGTLEDGSSDCGGSGGWWGSYSSGLDSVSAELTSSEKVDHADRPDNSTPTYEGSKDCHLYRKEQLSPVSAIDFHYEEEQEEEETEEEEEETRTVTLWTQSDFHDSLAQIYKSNYEVETRARQLLQVLVNDGCSAGEQKRSVDEFLLLDFFAKSLSSEDTWRVEIAKPDDRTVEGKLLTKAKRWLDGCGLVGDGEGSGRLQMEELEADGRWRCFTFKEEERDVAGDVEGELWVALLDEVLLDLI